MATHLTPNFCRTTTYGGSLYHDSPDAQAGTAFPFIPAGVLTEGADGNFYGIASSGGATGGNSGSVYRLNPAGVVTNLYNFKGKLDFTPCNLLQASNGYLYGMSTYSGALGQGTIYSISTTGTFAILNTTVRIPPFGACDLVQGENGLLYGMSPTTIFSIPPTPLITQTITFPLQQAFYGETITLNASSSSGQPVTLSALGGPGTLSGNQLTLTGAGNVRIRAFAPGDAAYKPATVDRTFLVRKASQTLTPFAAVPNKVYPSAPFNVTLPTASSGLPVTLYVKYGPATVSGNTATVTGRGTVLLAAYQAGNANYAPSKTVTTRFIVSAASP